MQGILIGSLFIMSSFCAFRILQLEKKCSEAIDAMNEGLEVAYQEVVDEMFEDIVDNFE